jgi:hypothetical protein
MVRTDGIGKYGRVIAKDQPPTKGVTAHFKFERYRWFIPWADHDGDVHIDVPPIVDTMNFRYDDTGSPWANLLFSKALLYGSSGYYSLLDDQINVRGSWGAAGCGQARFRSRGSGENEDVAKATSRRSQKL